MLEFQWILCFSSKLYHKISLTVVGNFPRLMKFSHFYAPKSWSQVHLLTWFSFILSRIEWWTTLTMEIFLYELRGNTADLENCWKCHFWTLGRILSPCRCNWNMWHMWRKTWFSGNAIFRKWTVISDFLTHFPFVFLRTSFYVGIPI